MKLLFVIGQFYSGGAEKSLLNLFKKLDRSKYDIDFIIMNQKPSKEQVSLVPELPADIHVLDVWKRQRRFSPVRALKDRCFVTARAKSLAPSAALLYVRNREYDWAFHVGEWWSPAFTALYVKAKHKAVWIHNDLSQAEYFGADEFFRYDEAIDRYIFVSNYSMLSSLSSFPFIKDKSTSIYNINDVEDIREKAQEQVEEKYFDMGLPVLVTCANVRLQKNHRRQLEAMALLKKRGIDFIWLNIGATVEKGRCESLLEDAKKFGLENRFLLLGTRKNPYKYMSKADAVTVLSNYESWSMVITEAKILGVPVISTKTSGALEQIEDGRTGILTDFSTTHIADQIQRFLADKELAENIRQNIKNFDQTEEILQSFDDLVNDPTSGSHRLDDHKEILYIIDDINYQGGAHIATILQIQEFLKKGHKISIFSSSIPAVGLRTELAGVKFLSWGDFPEDRLFNRRLLDCLTDAGLSRQEKSYKMKLSWEGKVKRNQDLFEEMVLPRLVDLFSGYRTICVMSEGSSFRPIVAKVKNTHKVQWMHIDYCQWRIQDDWTRRITKNDGDLYRAFDTIVVLSQNIKDSFIKLYPHLEEKVVINKNIIPAEEILRKAGMRKENEDFIHFVTVGRIEEQKAYHRLFTILQRLYANGYRFYWTMIGGGEDYTRIRSLFQSSDLKNYVTMTGNMLNPFPIVKEADVFALLSQYEGLPNTIFESLILGTPVIATNVGGVSTQIQHGKTGWLVENNEDDIYRGLKHILDHPEEIAQVSKELKNYQYDNTDVLRRAEDVLFI